jgi:uncharacterized protein DUF87
MIEVLKKLPFGFILEDSKPSVQYAKPVKKTKASKPKKHDGPPVPIMDIGHEVFTGKPFLVDTSKFISAGERDAFLASSGMGKSYLTGVVLEEILDKSQQVVFIIDPEGEWYTLQERYNNDKRSFKVIGRKGKTYNKFPVDLRFSADADEEQIQDAINAFERQVNPLVKAMISGGVSCVFDTSSLGDKEKCAATAVICEAVFQGELNLSDDDDNEHQECRKVRLFFDEAHTVAPQTPNKFQGLSLESITKIAKRGRKRNIHMAIITQRPASINKDVLSQCNRAWLGGITNENDYKANKSFYLSAGLKLQHVQALEPGHFIYAAGAIRVKIKSRKRYTRHGGATKKESSKPIVNAAQADELLSRFF